MTVVTLIYIQLNFIFKEFALWYLARSENKSITNAIFRVPLRMGTRQQSAFLALIQHNTRSPSQCSRVRKENERHTSIGL